MMRFIIVLLLPLLIDGQPAQFSYPLSSSIEERIVGGQPAVLGEFPYQVSLRLLRSWEVAHLCGGSVLSSSWVLTAAHCCVYAAEHGDDAFFVVAGEVDTYEHEGTEQIVKSQRIVVHPQFDENTANNDVCLIQLQQPLALNEYVNLVDLPSIGDTLSPGQALTATGYGVTTEGGFPSQLLLKVDMPFVSDAICRECYEGINEVQEGMICAGDLLQGGHATCQGDSGGALVIKDSFLQMGIVSWARGCGHPDYPTVFAEVAHYVEWIQANSVEANQTS